MTGLADFLAGVFFTLLGVVIFYMVVAEPVLGDDPTYDPCDEDPTDSW